MSVTYVLDENRNIQTVEPKLVYYTSLTCFEVALPDIEVGSLVAMPEEDTITSSSSNEERAAPPVGFVYIRFPGMDDPNTLFPGTTWENISSQYPGAFFRAEGGNASAFGSGLQTCLTAVNGLSASSSSSGAHSHTYQLYTTTSTSTAYIGKSTGAGISIPPVAKPVSATINTCYYSFTHCHNVSLSGTANETRPVNVTVQIYKRTI